jgi:hypothetical protein
VLEAWSSYIPSRICNGTILKPEFYMRTMEGDQSGEMILE